MSCSSPLRELVTFYLAGTLEPAEAALVARHLEECADCRNDAVDGRALIDGLRELHLTADEVVAAAANERASPHLLVCSRCRDEVALLRTMNADLDRAPAGPETIGHKRKPLIPARWSRPAVLAALAAAAALVGAVWIVAPSRPANDRGAVRGGASDAVVGLSASPESGTPAFSWTPFPAATAYRVELFTADGRPVWTREVAAPPMTWPGDVTRSPGAYRWRVEALAAGVVVARSPVTDLNLAP